MLEPTNLYVEKVCLSLVREYVIRRNFSRTLAVLNEETAPLNPKIGFYSSRLELGRDLGVEGLMRVNKESRHPLQSMLEVLVKCFLQDRELLLRSTFANSCFYTSRVKQKKRKKEVGRNVGLIGTFSSPSPPPSFNSHQQHRPHQQIPVGHQFTQSQLDHIVPSSQHKHEIEQKQDEEEKEPRKVQAKTSKPQKVKADAGEKSECKGEMEKVKAESEKVSPRTILEQEQPMATFVRKLQAEARITATNSRTSLSLETSQESSREGDDYDGEGSWIPEDSKSRSHLQQSQSRLDKRSTSQAEKSTSEVKSRSDRSNSDAGAYASDLKSISEVKSKTDRSHFERRNSDARGQEVKSNLALGQTLLESKQNLLAQSSLSPEENHIRQQVQESESVSSFLSESARTSPSKSKQKSMSGNGATSRSKTKSHKSGMKEKSSSTTSSSSSSSKSTTVTTDQGLKIRDVDSLQTPSDESGHTDTGGSQSLSSSSSSKKTSSKSKTKNPEVSISNKFFEQSSVTSEMSVTRSSVIKTLDQATWQRLKLIVLGERGIVPEGWVGQGFAFNYNIPYALVQKKGGPCGVLAAVQAMLLRNLMFGSAFCDPNDLPMENFDLCATSSSLSELSKKRSLALIGTLTQILWRCGTEAKGSGSAEEPRSVTVGLTSGGSFGPGSELRVFNNVDSLKMFIEANLYRFDCLGLVYSVVLSRGIEAVQEDMDFQNSPLLGQHGYCTQELLNLLIMGRAISNAFDNDVVLDDKRLKGLSSQSDIGFLSLFEHYNSCKVGLFFKNPKFPVWIVCSESHFSLLFSDDMDLTASSSDEHRPPFDLFYYDGLARQDKIIRLTITPSAGNDSDNIRSARISLDDDLIPPLDKCIRTKWNGAEVDWNETEPIL